MSRWGRCLREAFGHGIRGLRRCLLGGLVGAEGVRLAEEDVREKGGRGLMERLTPCVVMGSSRGL